ncbi:monovalent cation/H+ antiporter subunit D [Stutzerimonas kunmingensis]|jgi:multicomponent K+:H+ antiporter subunit D|uniref:Cation:proton antiporter n=1 Tax=Stutzerimonas chloritidismutans AW-1 TaxID=1263865 RepID=V4QF39_STUCH|nr:MULTISPECIES: monovalent cation/H+ antiporter subunit D [Stutzerimonas stutzeri subgroup]MBU0562295.1 monovalent cation/H+ antiporter subunit D [Gammaproteobacteria bacterium]OHC15038.1 MAG: monovalent cation/H+ antiporter subunit D [Pseudomonadales bacterium GWC2_63_15]ESR01345.1 cation:proton antiporter [Stutzerimonas chloritidismutans AW-1]MBU0836385.1 monovalent cation/H+ antiporter subunit D [Gammaproteobacteria bacterium]MBU1806790.1 monovalent cation/H+ antiporter subunit D [Gammapro|tara:strand:- start:144 stop:1643 length:1500 start_codon:yes stop_codon:yes gene_type:complete
MNHALILPLLLPLFMGALLLFAHRANKSTKRLLSLAATWTLVPIAIWLVLLADDGQLRIYALGSWQPPFGIILMLDRLSALMLLVTAVLAGFAALYACRGDDERGPNFHALYQFQLLGINGAFLTGDLFNLFVFFEILLISSYALLLHGHGQRRVRSGMHYVVLNLLGSSLFLIGVSMLYGLLGTLNMVDMAARVSAADPADAPLLAAAGYLLLVVFALKGAILPLYFWLPRAYASATAPVAALFAIMTKVGLYAIIRVFTLVFGSEAGELSGMVDVWLWPLALLTLGAAVIGALAARSLQVLLAYLVVVSVGTLLAGIALGSEAGLAAALYYLVHSTLVAGGLFLLADLIARQRGDLGTDLISAPALRQPLLLGTLFFMGAISVAGLPPFSGFLGKVMLLRAIELGADAIALWAVVLVGGLGMLISLSRAGSLVFWRPSAEAVGQPADAIRVLATVGLLLGSVMLVVAAGPLQAFVQATAAQLLDVAPYLQILQGGAA